MRCCSYHSSISLICLSRVEECTAAKLLSCVSSSSQIYKQVVISRWSHLNIYSLDANLFHATELIHDPADTVDDIIKLLHIWHLTRWPMDISTITVSMIPVQRPNSFASTMIECIRIVSWWYSSIMPRWNGRCHVWWLYTWEAKIGCTCSRNIQHRDDNQSIPNTSATDIMLSWSNTCNILE